MFITPRIGKLKIVEVLRSDVATFHHSMREIPYQANRVIGILSVMLAQAELWGLRPEGYNPCRGIKKFKEEKRERFLSLQELKKLGEALEAEQLQSPYVAHFFRLLILTGCRLGEIQSLKWDYVDFENSILRLPDSIYLGAATVNELKRIPKVIGNPHVVKAEFVAMRLAHIVGINVAPVKLTKGLGKDVLLIERFDRTFSKTGWERRALVSALTMLELDELEARYASYEDFSTLIRHRFTDPKQTLEELFGRLVFNILVGNTDDHARNHAAFWDGHDLTLTPAYDICPQGRTGGEARQAMLITGNKRLSLLTICLEAAPQFLLGADRARTLITSQLATIRSHWNQVCDEAGLTEVDRAFLWGRQFLNPFALQSWAET